MTSVLRVRGRGARSPSPLGGVRRAALVLSALAYLATPLSSAVVGEDSIRTAHFTSKTTPTGRMASTAGECAGVRVVEGADLGAVMESEPPGTTFCLPAAPYRIRSTITVEAGDRVIGTGRDATFIDGSELAPTSVGIFEIDGDSYFADLDVSGAPTPTADGAECGTRAAPYKSDCGMAFAIGGFALTLQSVDCHDNGGACIGGGGSADVVVDNLDCWSNGSAYSMTPEFAYAACIKRAAIYADPGNTTVTNSYIHDNPWVGIWCDFCKHGFFHIENNRIVGNGRAGVQWEMSGGWTSSDHALVSNNLFRRNNYLNSEEGGGVIISTANDVTIESNAFQANRRAAVNIVFTPSRDPPQRAGVGIRVANNMLSQDVILGCGRSAIPKRLVFLLREDPRGTILALILVLGVVAVLVLLVRSRRRVVLLSIVGALVVLCFILLLLLLGSGAACLENV